MNNRNKLTQSLVVVALTAVTMAVVTIAWFINSASPFMDGLNMSSSALNVNVTIESIDEEGRVIPEHTQADEAGNTIMVVKYIKPGDSLLFSVKTENLGGPCKLYFGIADIENFDLDADGNFVKDATETPLSKMIKITLMTQNPQASGEYMEAESFFLSDLTLAEKNRFFFNPSFELNQKGEPDAVKTFRYQVEFVGKEPAGSGNGSGSGALAGNDYTEKKMTAKFAVVSTLAK